MFLIFGAKNWGQAAAPQSLIPCVIQVQARLYMELSASFEWARMLRNRNLLGWQTKSSIYLALLAQFQTNKIPKPKPN